MEDVKSLTLAIQELSQVVKGMNKEQAPDMNPSELLEMFVQKQADLGVSQAMGHGTREGHSSPRPKTAAEKVREYLEINPSARYEPVRELAEIIGVGKSTVSRVLNE